MDLSKSYEFFQPEKIGQERVHIIGCGSVGSTVAENLARFGITNFVLWDFDIVEQKNIANQMFREEHVGKEKVDALLEMLCEINPDVIHNTSLKRNGWNGELLDGYVFLAVDSIETRKAIVEKNYWNMSVKAVFDFRTGLTDAQHYAADWSSKEMKKNLLASMDFTHEEAEAETPMSACHVTLSVAPTVRVISAYGVSNFVNFVCERGIKKMILADAFNFMVDAF